jgi:acetyl-CoA synthetase
MSEIVPVPPSIGAGSPNPILDLGAWRDHYQRVANDPDAYWLAEAARLVWRTPPTRGLDGSFYEIADGPIAWFADGVLNVNDSCVDRHAAATPDRAAIVWEGDEPGTTRTLTWAQLKDEVCRCANALEALGLQRGERAIIYMGMVPEAAIAMLAVARIGAVHSVVFGGFSAESLRDRVRDSGARLVVTQDEGRRGGRTFALKSVVDEALVGAHVPAVLVLRRTGADVPWSPGRDVWWHEAVASASSAHEAAAMPAESPLFILYTSGSTGKPKGLLHTTGGYLTWASWTHRTVFDVRPDDVWACVADVGWVTGHSYIVYGPLANGVTTLMFESTPLYPDAGRYWDVVARHKVTAFYTAPTAIRAIAACPSDFVTKYDRSTLRVLGTVGEPINADAWRWYHDVVGEGRCAVVDTWWQTETGGICIAPIAPATPTKPGAATLPLPGITPILLDNQDRPVRGPGNGRLYLTTPWPGMARTIWGDHPRFVATYFPGPAGMYLTGDGARRDADGYYWITGRVDDVINVSGHRMGTAEFEGAIASLDEVAECAVVGYPHALKGQGVYAYVVLQAGFSASAEVEAHIQAACRTLIGAHARVDLIQVVPGLPKTRSGKVMRRILRKIAEGDTSNLGDTSTLNDPTVVDAILRGAKV